ncbi:MAG TPA: VWA domain-containing protein [Desulfohalobiaceae bacterium]|nr:VWA domain-containing protein [Desulfohalobiaceae bacterium]
MNSLKIFFVLLALCIVCFSPESTVAEKNNYPEVMFILDGSGSMWGKAGGQTKIEAAKQVMTTIIPELPKEVRFGLVAYGHRRKGDCKDVETLIQSGSTDKDALLKSVQAISPKGKTPIAASIKMVVDSLKTKENETTIILVSDGMETCHEDPCGLVQELSDSGIKFVLHVVGFDVDEQGRKQLQCLAKAGKGNFFAVNDANSLLAALQKVNKRVTKKVEEAKTETVKKATGLGKLQLQLPEGTENSLKGMEIVRTSDNKKLKKTEDVTGTHPLPAGKYEVVLLFAKPNFRDPDPISIGTYEVLGGESTRVTLGGLDINIAKDLTKAIEGVVIVDEKSGQPWLEHISYDNNYYMFKPRPVPEGRYSLQFIYTNNENPTTISTGLSVTSAETTTATLDSGLKLEEAKSVQAWELVNPESKETVLRVKRDWDNQFPLWYPFPVQPGKYDLMVEIKGMTEPLLAGQGLEVKSGETVVFSTGL